jgi:hypothetical protein
MALIGIVVSGAGLIRLRHLVVARLIFPGDLYYRNIGPVLRCKQDQLKAHVVVGPLLWPYILPHSLMFIAALAKQSIAEEARRLCGDDALQSGILSDECDLSVDAGISAAQVRRVLHALIFRDGGAEETRSHRYGGHHAGKIRRRTDAEGVGCSSSSSFASQADP